MLMFELNSAAELLHILHGLTYTSPVSHAQHFTIEQQGRSKFYPELDHEENGVLT